MRLTYSVGNIICRSAVEDEQYRTSGSGDISEKIGLESGFLVASKS